MPYGDYTKENNFGELTNCETNTEGSKSSARPKVFCDTVTMNSTLTVQGPTTLNDTQVVPPAITVGGRTYVPTQITIPVIGAGGVVASYSTITVLAAQG